MKILVAIIFVLILSHPSFGQANSFSVSGTIVDSTTGKGVELATVVVKAVGSDKIVSGVITDADGKFLLDKVGSGKYQLSVTAVGYNPGSLPIEIQSNQNVGAIKLSLSAKTLGEAVVTSERSLIVKNSEKTVYNVAQSPTNQTGTAEDVLRNMPGVSVDQKGNISIIGKTGAKILVDGRPNALAQNDLPGFLRSIPASSIEAIELITNPSARYDAEGNAGIINIKLKKGRADGLNGSVSAGYGFLDKYDGDAAINYRKNKINVFANYSINVARVDNRWTEARTIGVNDTTTYYNLASKGKTYRVSTGLKAGLDYFINDKNTLTYTVGGNYSRFRWLSDALGTYMNSSKEVIASYNSTDDELYNNFSITNDLAYKKKFDSTERELDIDISHTYVKGSNGAALNSLGYDSSGVYSAGNSLQRRTRSDNGIHNFVFQLDYVHPLKRLKGYKVEAGVKNETTLNANVFNAFKTVNNIEQPDSLLSNKFNYSENIAAAYLMMSGAYKKSLAYSAGLRAEHTFIRSNNNSVDKNYISFFPSATIQYSINSAQSLSASYSRRIQRPGFRQINNTISYIDQYSTWQGNSFLRPAFSHIVSLNYTIMVKKHMFSFEPSGNFLTDGFTEYSHVDSNRITRGGNVNGVDSKSFNFTFYAKLQLTKWWDFQMNHNYSYSYYGFKPGVNTRSSGGHSYNLWASTSFKFWKGCVLEVNGWFNSGGVQPQGIVLPVGVLNASLKKSFFKDHFTVSIAGTNLANSMKWRWNANNTDLNDIGSWQELNRTVMVTLSYRFGSNSAALERKEKEGNSRLDGGKGR